MHPLRPVFPPFQYLDLRRQTFCGAKSLDRYMKASRPCLGARHWSSGRSADRTWCRCDYTHVNYQCRHVRYVVKAWCTRYQARRVDPMPCSYWSSADVPGSSHVRCPPNIVAMYTSTLCLSCLAARLICHCRATKPENCGPLSVITLFLSEPLFARISFIFHSFGPQRLTPRASPRCS